MYPVCASRNTEMPSSSPASYGSINSNGTPFPGASFKTSFTDISVPAMKSWANAYLYKPITNITHSNGLISFVFMGSSTNTYTISAICGTNGTILPSGTVTVYEGSSETYTITPTLHHDIATVLINGVSNQTAVNTGTYTFSNVFSNQTIEATFKAKIYTVTFNANSGTGSMEPQNFTYGVSQALNPNTFTKPNAVFKGWNTQSTGSGINFNDQEEMMLTYSRTLYAQWEMLLPEFTITATATTGGEISPSGIITLVEGESQLFTISPQENFSIIDVIVNNLSIGTSEEYLFENITENQTIHAVFEYMGIEEYMSHNYSSLHIIPNPANDYIDLRFELLFSKSEIIEFYNSFGQLVKNVPLNGEPEENRMTQRILISDLSKGIYLIKVGGETVKLVVR